MRNHILPIRSLNDNYIWAILNPALKQAVIVDPGEAAPVIAALATLRYALAGILVTHHHWDHTNGIEALLAVAEGIPVIASQESPNPFVTQPVSHGEQFVCSGLPFTALAIPGHTLDHTAYFNDQPLIFTGDTLFSAGCGRIFEGTPTMMYASLNQLAALNDETEIYCGHEYTATNLRFASAVEPNNPFIKAKMMHLPECTLPVTLGDEKQYNPFLRCHIPTVRQAAEHFSGKELTTAVEVFTVIREWKNSF